MKPTEMRVHEVAILPPRNIITPMIARIINTASNIGYIKESTASIRLLLEYNASGSINTLVAMTTIKPTMDETVIVLLLIASLKTFK